MTLKDTLLYKEIRKGSGGMNKTAIKKYAIRARAQLIEAVKQRAYEYGITETSRKLPEGKLLTETETKQYRMLTERINEKGYSFVMEEAAYTWFNRFMALRFMEANGYLPSKIRVFTDENGKFAPEILRDAVSIEQEGTDKSKILELVERQDNEELYKYLLIAQCNALNDGLPYMFEKISGWLELLFPKGLLRKDSVIGCMIDEVPEEDWLDAVQIIGWLYQYYNTELKDETFALLKQNVKISKEHIPAATQLFTPDFIVRYMVENSLGRLWLKSHYDEKLKKNWKYYIDQAEQNKEEITENPCLRPEEIKFIDPCAGSGQILVYAFDVLMQIYLSCGFQERDAARSILENNLFGLDIDDRAGQLAYFSVMMKARKYDRKILERGITPNVFAVKDTAFMDDEFISFFAEKNGAVEYDLTSLRSVFADAKEYGSLIEPIESETKEIKRQSEEICTNSANNIFGLIYKAKAQALCAIAKQAEMLTQKYHVVVTNPPYMGASGMSAKLYEFVRKHYPDSKNDLFAVFIERCAKMLDENGYLAMLTQHAWMFLSGYEKLRRKLLKRTIINMIHLGARAFEEIGGEVVQTVGFVIKNADTADYKGTYCRLTEPTTQREKEECFLSGKNRYVTSESVFSKIPGSPVAYWVSDSVLEKFEKCPKLNDVGITRLGMTTGENARFVRYWYEIDRELCEFDVLSQEELDNRKGYWVPYNKGGAFRKWYGNNDCVLYWKNGGEAVKTFADEKGRIRSTVPNTEYYFKPCASWSKISTGKISFRYKCSSIFDVAGACYFAAKYDLRYMMGLLNSSVVDIMIGALSPTLNYEGGQIASLPVLYDSEKNDTVCGIVEENINISKKDWDSFETSWDFKRHPLV